MLYIDMVENVILGLVYGCHEGNWDLHLHAILNMIPWCFAYDILNYARHLFPYFAEMTNEESSCASSLQKMSSNNPFGLIPVDQTTEVTINKNT